MTDLLTENARLRAAPAMSDLRALIEAVEAGEVRMSQCASAFPSESAGGLCTWHRVWAAYHGSLDAAKALHEALLTGYGWCVGPWGARVWLYSDRPEWDRPVRQEVEKTFAPARAWLLAILRAKEAGQ